MIVKTPPMGWNTWNTFGEKISEDMIKESADAMVKNGLLDAGYNYLVIDDCWAKRQRNPETQRMEADPEKFPNGMKAVADYVHSKGLKFGMYSCAGVRTCAGYPGSYGHEFLDAETFADFDIDFLKYDYCFRPHKGLPGEMLYHRMGNALRATDKDILFSACNWGQDDVFSWIRATGAHMYRSTYDIVDNFKSFKDISTSQIDKMCYNTPGCFNDMDMLTVGMFGKGNVGSDGCNARDYKLQFSVWCIMGSPLMLGCDIRSMDEETLKLITNKELIRINQDPECRQAFRLSQSWDKDGVVLARKLENGDFAIGIFNFNDYRSMLPVYFEDIGYPADCGLKFEVHNVLTGEKFTCVDDSMSTWIDEHDAIVYRVTPVKK